MKFILLVLFSSIALAKDVSINVIKQGATLDSETGKIKYADGVNADDVVRQLLTDLNGCVQQNQALQPKPKAAKATKKDAKIEDVIKSEK